MDFDLSGFQTVHLEKKNGSILREKRVVLGLTQKDVAERAKITLRQYQKFESGERNIMTCSFQMWVPVPYTQEVQLTLAHLH